MTDSERLEAARIASAQRQPLGFWQIWNMSFGFLGIQVGWALQMANRSSIYEYLGAAAHEIPFFRRHFACHRRGPGRQSV